MKKRSKKIKFYFYQDLLPTNDVKCDMHVPEYRNGGTLTLVYVTQISRFMQQYKFEMI